MSHGTVRAQSCYPLPYSNMCVLRHVCAQGIRKETCWALSNIAAGSAGQVEALVANTELIRAVVAVSAQDDWDVRKEAAWVISNICTGGQVCIRLGLALLVPSWRVIWCCTNCSQYL